MNISLSDIGKKFNNKWLFREVNLSFEAGKTYAITGANGSGKSTLLKMLFGYITPDSGKIAWNLPHSVEPERLFSHMAFCAPYTELPENYDVNEILDWYFGFKPIKKGLSKSDLVGIGKFAEHLHKPIGQFSSGMKQRLKLLLALFSDSSVVLLDEPGSNLDRENKNWYLENVKTQTRDRILIIASNDEEEYSFCQKIYPIDTYKK